MKRSLTKFLLVSLFAGSFVFAQSTGAGHTPNPANMAQRRVKYLTTLLTLTSSQQASAITIFTNSATANLATAATMKTTRQSLKTAIQGNDAAALPQITSTIGTLTAQEALTNAQAEAAFYQLLNPTQQTQYTQFQSANHGRFGGNFRGPR